MRQADKSGEGEREAREKHKLIRMSITHTHNLVCFVQEKRSEEQKEEEEEEEEGEKEEGERRRRRKYLVQYLKFRLDLSLFLYSCVQS